MINLGVLKNLTWAKKYMQGTVISNSGGSSTMFIVLKGEVGVYANSRKPSQEPVATIGPGEFFGETALFLEKSKPFSAVALTDVIALPIHKNAAIDFISNEPEMAFELLKAMCERLEKPGVAHEETSGRTELQLKAAPQDQTIHAKEADPSPSAPTAAPQELLESSISSLFPRGHGSYQLPLHNEDRVHLMEKNHVCPICKSEFKALSVKNSQLVLERTDSDLRNRYKGVEPLYYDVVTCPNCLYSALIEMFNSPEKQDPGFSRSLQAFKQELGCEFGARTDTSSVFAGYYLALYCAPYFFLKHQMATAKLLLKLSRLYQDCGDEKMEKEMDRKALDAYLYVYQNVEVPLNQEQQLCIIIGELYYKFNDLKNARDFFFKARVNRAGAPFLKTHAENRIQDIRTTVSGLDPAQ